jgi:peptide/nickel transport system substrate-binding protein
MRIAGITRRTFVKQVGGGLALAGLAAACGPLAPSSAGQNNPPTPVAPAQARRGETLIIGSPRSIATTLPYPGPQFIFGWGGLFNPLISLDAKSQPVPSLAESWTLSDDRQTLTFKLRQGVVFHSGRKFTADEAKWNIEYVKDPKNAAAAGGELKNVEVGVVNAGTIELRLPDVIPHIFSLLAGVLIADPQSDIALNAAGTGPFKLDSFSPGDEMHLVRNERYWRSDRPFLDGVTFKSLPDPSSAAVALEAGAAGIVQVAPSDVQRLKTGSETSVVILPDSGSYDFALSAVDPPFTDRRVRQAIDLALDRKRFAETVMYGLTEPTYIIWLRMSPAWNASIDVGEFNLDKAHQLLTEAGYPNGFETKIQGNPTLPELLQFDQIVQEDLAKIGVRLTIEQLDPNQALTQVTQAKFSAIANHSYAYGDQDPAMQFTAFVLRPEGNASRFQSDAYISQVQAARREPDRDKRMALYQGIARLVKDEAFLLPIANRIVPWGVRSNVRGFSRQPLLATPTLDELWLA